VGGWCLLGQWEVSGGTLGGGMQQRGIVTYHTHMSPLQHDGV
jgi:hypothetical protein